MTATLPAVLSPAADRARRAAALRHVRAVERKEWPKMNATGRYLFTLVRRALGKDAVRTRPD